MGGFFGWLKSTEFDEARKASRVKPVYATAPLHDKVGQWYPSGTGTVRCLHCGSQANVYHLVEVAPPIAAADMCRVLADKSGIPGPTGVPAPRRRR